MRLIATVAAACLMLLSAILPAAAETTTAAPSSTAAPTADPAATSSTAQPSSGSATASPSSTASSSAAKPAPSETTTSPAPTVAATTGASPHGAVTFSARPGVVSFEGYALDPDDYSAPVTAMFTVDGQVAAYFVADGYSPQLNAYGVYAPHGLSGAFGVSGSDTNASLCMFLFNVGPGSSTLAQCSTVYLPSQSPSGGVSAVFDDRGNLNVSAYAFDPNAPAESLAVWIVDNGQLKVARMANDAQPSLAPYGIPGAHGASISYFAGTTGSHDICVYAVNVGAGSNAWIGCKTVQVTATGGYNDPRGDFGVHDTKGGVTVVGWAFDANDFNQPTTVMWTVDGNVVAYSLANLASEYLGLPGNHGTVARLSASAGKHTVCMFVGNIDEGSSQLVRCADVTVTGGWQLPVQGYYTSCYCARWGTFHWGIDIANSSGTPMYAAADGVVVSAGPVNGYGNLIVIKHPESGIYTAYAHMYTVGVYVGQYVSRGQKIAVVGAYGNVTGPHLHFETWWGPSLYQNRTDPAKWLVSQGVTLPPYTP